MKKVRSMKRNLLFFAILGVLTVVVYALNIESNKNVLLLPFLVLAVFQLTDKGRRDW